MPHSYSWTLSLLAGALVAFAGSVPANAQEFRYSGSLGFSSGSYIFSDRTESYSFFNGLEYSRGRFSLSAALPVIAQNSQEVAFLGGGMMPTGRPSQNGLDGQHAGTGMAMGGGDPDEMHGTFDATVGDPIVRGSVTLGQGMGAIRSLAVEAMMKAPLAPVSSGVGTGQWDLGLRASSVLGVRGNLLFAGVSLWAPGDMPDLVLKEYVDVSVGIGRLLGRRWGVLTSLNFASAIIESVDPPSSLGLSFGFRPTSGRSLSAGVSLGLSEASPDLTLSLGWSLGFVDQVGRRSLGQNGYTRVEGALETRGGPTRGDGMR